jgi:hypothetical protein
VSAAPARGNAPAGALTVNASLRYQRRVSGRDAEIAEALSVLAADT